MNRPFRPKRVSPWIHVLPAILFGVGILALSQLSNPPRSETVPDYLGHFVGYALFAVTLLWAMTSGRKKPLTLKRVILCWFIAAAWGGVDEWQQSFVPNRHASLLDVLADSLGAGFSLLLIYGVRLARRNSQDSAQGGERVRD